MIVELLKKLITKKYYKEKADIENKLNVFYAMNKISDEEYSELTLSVREIATKMKAMREDQNKMNERLKIIEEKPIKDYEDTKKQVKGKVISFITGIILTAIAFALGLSKFM